MYLFRHSFLLPSLFERKQFGPASFTRCRGHIPGQIIIAPIHPFITYRVSLTLIVTYVDHLNAFDSIRN